MSSLPAGFVVRESGPPEGFEVRQSRDEHDFNVMNMLKNVPSSAGEYVGDIAATLSDPIGAATGVWNVVQGVGDKLGIDVDGEDQSMYADAVGKMISDRYGSVDKFQRSLETDPVGVLSDISGILSGGATAVAGRLPRVAATAQTASRVLDPASAVLAPARAIGRIDPNQMYQEVMKFGTTNPLADRRQWAQTLMDERIVPGEAGVEKLTNRMQEVGDRRNALIAAADEAGVRLDPQDMLAGLDDLKSEVGGFRAGAAQNVKAIDDFVDGFIAEHGLRGKVTVKEVQDFKSDLYNQINWKASRAQGQKIDEDIYKAVGRTAKAAIEEVAPEVGELNRRWGEMIDASKPFERSSARIDNRNAIGLQTPMVATAAEFIAPGIGGVTAGGASLLTGPKNKARLALAINEIQKANGRLDRVPSRVLSGLTNAEVRQAVIQAGRLQQAESERPPLLQAQAPSP